jgi:quercetin dioxygenase-like cupin family protein
MTHSKIKKDTEDLLGQAVKSVDLVGYQESSVVSRMIVDKDTGSLTLFAFDERQGLGEHTAPFDALVYVIDGEAEVTISGKSLNLTGGELVIIPANQPHTLRAIKRFKMMLVMIKS